MSPRSPWVIASSARVNLRQRSAALLLSLLILPAAPANLARAAGARPGASTTLEVRKSAPAEALPRSKRTSLPTSAEAMKPADLATLEARLARRKAFLPLEAELHARAARVGAGPTASRRPSWRAAAGAATRRFAIEGAPPPPTDTIRLR